MKKQLGVRGVALVFLASGLVACSSAQPKHPNEQNPNQQQQQQQSGQAPEQQNAAQPGQPGQAAQAGQPGQPGQAAPGEVPPPPTVKNQLGVVSEAPTISRVPRERTVIEKQDIPTVTITRVGADINRMSAADFKALGAPSDLAQGIIQYRNAYGPFKSVKDLAKVPHMDEKWLAQNEEQLAVSPISAAG